MGRRAQKYSHLALCICSPPPNCSVAHLLLYFVSSPRPPFSVLPSTPAFLHSCIPAFLHPSCGMCFPWFTPFSLFSIFTTIISPCALAVRCENIPTSAVLSVPRRVQPARSARDDDASTRCRLEGPTTARMASIPPPSPLPAFPPPPPPPPQYFSEPRLLLYPFVL